MKHNISIQKDREISDLLAIVNSSIAQTIADQSKIKSSIVALLEHISDGIMTSDKKLPFQDQLKDMKEKVTFKEKHSEAKKQ